ncbi:MAG: glycosyltransferase family 4 protein [Patescibacteria group bacterium]
MLKSIFWKPYSRLFIIGDNTGWVTDVEAADLKNFAEKLGVKAEIVKRMYFNLPQAVHYTSQFSLLLPIYKSRNRLSVDYYHGKPKQGENFQRCFEALEVHHGQFARVRVSNKEMERLVKSSGIDPQKVVRIPIGVDLKLFKHTSPEKKRVMREKLNIPQDAVVIGSFQKDGSGWGEGLEPKLIKGPDIFLKVVGKIKKDIPNLWVLLSGPSRGYVKNGLERLGVSYRHKYFKNISEISNLYDALDLYLVTSREEGGPKACLESMAKGIPLVTTRVGQVKDLVINGENAMMAPVDDVEKLSAFSLEVLQDKVLEKKLIQNGFKTARNNSHESQLPLWKEYFKGLVAYD